MYAELRQVWDEWTAVDGHYEVIDVEVRGQRLRTYRNAPSTLRDLWLSTGAFENAEYLVYNNERITYREAHRQVAQIAHWLISHGVEPGDRVAIAMRNYPEWMLAYWACVATGVTCVGMNAWWAGPEMAHCLRDSNPKVVIADEERLNALTALRAEVADRILVGVRASDAPALTTVPWDRLTAGNQELPDAKIDPDSDACIFYTSGTTGRPKGAQLTHRGCCTNVMGMRFAVAASTEAARRASADKPGKDSDSRRARRTGSALVVTPLFHVTANNCVAHVTTMAGGKLVLMYKWDAGEALRLIEREKVSTMSGVPVMSRELLSHPGFKNYDTTSLAALGGGGAALHPALVESIHSDSPTARPTTGYGMTEVCGVITMNSAGFLLDRPSSAGPILPSFEARIVDDHGCDLPDGQTGELWVRGAQVIKGYLNEQAATAETITEGWLHTSDLARLDSDGFLYIVDRLKDMVLRGGENVYCAEVEAAVFEHDAVEECAVFGVDDARLGEEVAAAVRLKPGSPVGAEDLREHLRELIAAYKVPRYIWITSERLPRGATGKFLKKQLRESLELKNAG